VDKVDAEVYPPTSGVITLLAEESTEVRQGAVIAQVT
jgi:pyruvate/2-oxoglutarate dehydrogenase complex dihydrolipoamide acyltransferase (E2) component